MEGPSDSSVQKRSRSKRRGLRRADKSSSREGSGPFPWRENGSLKYRTAQMTCEFAKKMIKDFCLDSIESRVETG